MKISEDKLALFTNKDELVNYLKINGISGSSASDHLAAWNKTKSRTVPKAKKRTTMVVTETDKTVETK